MYSQSLKTHFVIDHFRSRSFLQINARLASSSLVIMVQPLIPTDPNLWTPRSWKDYKKVSITVCCLNLFSLCTTFPPSGQTMLNHKKFKYKKCLNIFLDLIKKLRESHGLNWFPNFSMHKKSPGGVVVKTQNPGL